MSRRSLQSLDPPRESFFGSLSSNCSMIAVALFVFAFIFQNFAIPSASMASTLLVGDHVIVDRAALAPATSWAPLHYRQVRRDDVIVFYKPVLEDNGERIPLVKRVVGLPGDRIHLRGGVVYVNGVAQIEPFAAKPTAADYNPYVDEFPSLPPSDADGATAEWSVVMPQYLHNGELVVPPDSYFAMGDNRQHSLDSRFWGFVPRANIIGRLLLVYWSIETAELPDNASLSERAAADCDEFLHFFARTRWSRTFHIVR